jgi:sulfur carrier protein ThiS
MRVRVSLYGRLRSHLPPGATSGPMDLELQDGATLADALRALGILVDPSVMILRNGSRCSIETELDTEDEVTVLTMIGGG